MGKDESSGSHSTVLDFSHPLYLHPSDTQAVTLVTHTFKGTENYAIWSRAMRNALLAKNKLGIVDGTCSRENQEEALRDQWDRCNAAVLTWLSNSVDKEIGNGLAFFNNAHLVWVDLKERYDKSDGARIFSLHRSINSLVQGPMTDYVHLAQQQKLFQFLMGLNEVYHHPRSQILLMSPLPSVNQAYNMVMQDESQRQITSPTNLFLDNPAMAIKTPRTGRGRSYANVQEECSNCHKKGHTRENCYRIIGFPPGFRSNRGRGRT